MLVAWMVEEVWMAEQDAAGHRPPEPPRAEEEAIEGGWRPGPLRVSPKRCPCCLHHRHRVHSSACSVWRRKRRCTCAPKRAPCTTRCARHRHRAVATAAAKAAAATEVETHLARPRSHVRTAAHKLPRGRPRGLPARQWRAWTRRVQLAAGRPCEAQLPVPARWRTRGKRSGRRG